NFDDEWETTMTSHVRDSALANGFDLVLTLERNDPKNDWPARVATRRPSGVILGIIRPTARQVAELQALRIPLVLLDPRSDPDPTRASGGTTDWQGGHDAGEHLAACGYERFVFVSGVPQYRFGRARRDGFVSAISESLPDAEVTFVSSEWTDAHVTAS